MMYRLIFLTGNLKGQRITVASEPMTIGRDPECAICLLDKEVASKHAVLEHKALTGLQISDLGSMNKMLVNNREVKEAHLKHGDIIEIGRSRFLVQATVETDLTRKAAGIRIKNISLTPLLIIIPLLVVIYAVLSFCQKIMNESSTVPPAQVVVSTVRSNVSPTQTVAKIVKLDEKAATNTVAELPAPVSEEIRKMREDLVGIKQTVSELTAKPAPPSVALPPEGRQQSHVPLSIPATNRPIPEIPDPHIKIASIEQQKFQENEDFDEMRVITIGLQREASASNMKDSAVSIQVSFFDQSADGKSIIPTSAVVPSKPLKSPQWLQDTQAVAIASYVVPKGSRKTVPGNALTEQFYGYVVRVFYHDKLQDEDARPKALLNYSSGTLRKQNKSGGPVQPN